MPSKKLTDPSIQDLVTPKKTNVFHTVDITDTTDDPDGTSFRGNFDQLASFISGSKGLIKIVDKAGTFFTNLATANAYINSFTTATITNESFQDGVYCFTVPNGTSFAGDVNFLQSNAAYIIDDIGLINSYGDGAFTASTGNSVFKNCTFGTYSFNSATGNNTFGNCTFDDDSFAGATGNNTLGNCTYGNNAFNAATGVNEFGNILLSSVGNTFGGYSSGKFYINGTIGTTTAQNYVDFFLTSTASIFVKRANYTNNSGGIEGDLARSITNGATVFFGGIEITNSYGTIQQVLTAGNVANTNLDFKGATDAKKKVTIHLVDGGVGTVQVYDDNDNSIIEARGDQGLKVYNNAFSAPLFDVIRDNGVDTDKVKINTTKTELTQGTASKLLRLNASKEIVSSTYDEGDLAPETATTIAAINHGATTKTTLVDADEVTGQDSAASFSLIRTTWLNVWNYIKSKADTFYQPKYTDVANDQIITGTTITLPNTPTFIYGVYMNGLRLTLTVDYTVSGATITLTLSASSDLFTTVYKY